MKVKKISHIGLAVADLEPVRRMYTELLDLPLDHEEMLGELKIAFVPVGETNLELVQSTDPEGVMAKYVAKKGEGIHHIALEVEDIHSAVEELKAKGMEMIDKEPRPGAHGATIAFLHPKATHGVMIELVQPGPKE
jgi:methylmalonyl-CoA/ethylmalonyl-CoA epimerase